MSGLKIMFAGWLVMLLVSGCGGWLPIGCWPRRSAMTGPVRTALVPTLCRDGPDDLDSGKLPQIYDLEGNLTELDSPDEIEWNGTVSDLRAVREALRHICDGVQAIDGMDFDLQGDLRRTGDEIARMKVVISVPCMLCKDEEGQPFLVDDDENTEPNTRICEACSAKINAYVAREQPPFKRGDWVRFKGQGWDGHGPWEVQDVKRTPGWSVFIYMPHYGDTLPYGASTLTKVEAP